eukprot:jgi/Mesen1/5834/ME000297S05034
MIAVSWITRPAPCLAVQQRKPCQLPRERKLGNCVKGGEALFHTHAMKKSTEQLKGLDISLRAEKVEEDDKDDLEEDVEDEEGDDGVDEFDEESDFDEDYEDEEGEEDNEDEAEDETVGEEGGELISGLAGDLSEENFLEVGRIVAAHGLRGEMKVRSQTDFPEARFLQVTQIAPSRLLLACSY